MRDRITISDIPVALSTKKLIKEFIVQSDYYSPNHYFSIVLIRSFLASKNPLVCTALEESPEMKELRGTLEVKRRKSDRFDVTRPKLSIYISKELLKAFEFYVKFYKSKAGNNSYREHFCAMLKKQPELQSAVWSKEQLKIYKLPPEKSCNSKKSLVKDYKDEKVHPAVLQFEERLTAINEAVDRIAEYLKVVTAPRQYLQLKGEDSG